MTEMEAIQARHSVRQYLDKPIPKELRNALDSFAEALNEEGDLHIQILYDEPECFSSRMAHYGKFENVGNYIVMAGKSAPDLDERCGYYGERLVLKAQELGLNTCWVALTHGKSKAQLRPGEKEVIIIALGYGKNQGGQHKSKATAQVADLKDPTPDWFRAGVEAALLAPTAVNQQKFKFVLDGDRVSVKVPLIGTCLNIDKGIVKYHFEIGAGKEHFQWQ